MTHRGKPGVPSHAFEALLELSTSGLLLVLDDRLRVRRVGARAAKIAGRPAAELEGMSLIAAFGSAALDAVARSALSSAAPASGEAQMGRLGERSFRVEAVPVAGDGLVISLHDITDLRRAERMRRDFVANVSHELRTPLTSIKLLAETLADGAGEDPGSTRDFAVQIAREVDHLAQLVDELLELARIESGDVRLSIASLTPRELLEDLSERIRPVADRRGISVRVLDPPPGEDGHILAAADRERLGQALLNLAHNAVKYSHPGGEVRLGWSPSERGVRFEVADDGIGVPRAHRARIFERFYKADRSRARSDDRVADEAPGGTSAGLGLAIVRRIAEAHGGSVGLTSEEGVGSTFWIEVPRA